MTLSGIYPIVPTPFLDNGQIDFPSIERLVDFMAGKKVQGLAIMGALGYTLRKLEFEAAPIVLGVVLGPMLELSLRQALVMSAGSYAIFVRRPITAALLLTAVALLAMAAAPLVLRRLNWRERLGMEGQGK